MKVGVFMTEQQKLKEEIISYELAISKLEKAKKEAIERLEKLLETNSK